MLQTVSHERPNQQFAKILVPQDIPEGGLRLLEDLLAMSQKEQARLPLPLFKESFEVKGSHHGFTGTGSGDDKIAPAVMRLPLPLQRLQYPLLKRVGT